MQRIILTLLILGLFFFGKAQDGNKDPRCEYIKTATGYLMVLRQDDDVLKKIEELAKAEKIASANFTGIGFAAAVTFGFFDSKTKQFNPRTISNAEMGSITGSIAWNDKGPSLHTHGVAAGADFVAYAGHILSLKVGTGSMEIYITTSTQQLQRKIEQPLGANVLQLRCGE